MNVIRKRVAVEICKIATNTAINSHNDGNLARQHISDWEFEQRSDA
jgi:hypothetical protein